MKTKVRKCSEEFLHKMKIRHITDDAVKNGTLIVKSYCENCKTSERKLIKHHPDPCNPFKVIILCESCHVLVHRKIFENLTADELIAKGEEMKHKRLPIPIPLDYAEILGVDRTHLSHVNAGRRNLNREHCYLILEASLTDERLVGLHFLHLWPGDIRSKRWLDVPFNGDRTRRGK